MKKVEPLSDKEKALWMLQKKFLATGEQFVDNWRVKHNITISNTACTQVLKRSQLMGLETMYTLADALGCNAEEFEIIGKALDDNRFWKLFAQKKLSHKETMLIDIYKTLTEDRQELIDAMLQQMLKLQNKVEKGDKP